MCYRKNQGNKSHTDCVFLSPMFPGGVIKLSMCFETTINRSSKLNYQKSLMKAPFLVLRCTTQKYDL